MVEDVCKGYATENNNKTIYFKTQKQNFVQINTY